MASRVHSTIVRLVYVVKTKHGYVGGRRSFSAVQYESARVFTRKSDATRVAGDWRGKVIPCSMATEIVTVYR